MLRYACFHVGSRWAATDRLGVAYSLRQTSWAGPHTIQHWPGTLGHEVRNKVSTSVSYDIQTGDLATWGFLSNTEEERFECNELFKLYVDPEYKDPNGTAPSSDEAQRWYSDFLRCLHRFLTQHFSERIPGFASKKVE